jgi:hypothetical protein
VGRGFGVSDLQPRRSEVASEWRADGQENWHDDESAAVQRKSPGPLHLVDHCSFLLGSVGLALWRGKAVQKLRNVPKLYVRDA